MQSGENLFSQQIFAYAASAVGSVSIQLSYIYEQTMPEKNSCVNLFHNCRVLAFMVIHL